MMTRRFIFIFVILFGSICQIEAQDREPIRILFVGNSYTAGIKRSFLEMVEASLHSDAVVETITPGGKTLAFHLENPETVKRIQDGDWDYVVLQDQSQTPAVFPKMFQEAARDLDKIIDSSGAMTVFYMTWGRRDGDKQNAERFPTYEKMQKALTDSYASSARRAKARIAPVGEAWRAVRMADPSLGEELYKKDGSHPDSKGAYLAAAVFYSTIFGDDPIDVSFDGGLSASERKTILGAVAEATATYSNK